MKQWKHKCLRSVLVYRPNPLRPDRVTVGFVLAEVEGDSPRNELRFAPDLSSLHCIAPQLDLEAVEGMLLEVESSLRSVIANVKDLHNFTTMLPEDVPDELEVLAPDAVLTDDFDAEVVTQSEQLFRSWRTEELDEEQRANRHYGRIYLQRQLQSIFGDFDVWTHLDKKIAVDQFVLKGDTLSIECGYEDLRTNTYRMLDPVSLVSGLDRAKILALSWPRIHEGFTSQRGMQCELHAIVEDGVNRQAGRASDAWNWMESAGIVVDPVSMLPALAADARSALRL